MAKHKAPDHKRTLMWVALGAPGVLAFMANVSAKEAASNLASWFEVLGLPVPDFLKRALIDEQVTDAALAFYALLAGSYVLLLRKAKPSERHAE